MDDQSVDWAGQWVVLWESRVGGKGVEVVDSLPAALDAAEALLHTDLGSAIIERKA